MHPIRELFLQDTCPCSPFVGSFSAILRFVSSSVSQCLTNIYISVRAVFWNRHNFFETNSWKIEFSSRIPDLPTVSETERFQPGNFQRKAQLEQSKHFSLSFMQLSFAQKKAISRICFNRFLLLEDNSTWRAYLILVEVCRRFPWK